METSPETTPEIDTTNDYLLRVSGGGIRPFMPIGQMSKEKALRLAAWIVALMDESDGHADFNKVLQAVEST
jgi:hypothetical protein